MRRSSKDRFADGGTASNGARATPPPMHASAGTSHTGRALPWHVPLRQIAAFCYREFEFPILVHTWRFV